MELESVKNQYKSSLSSWFFFDYCLPIAFIVGFWPIALYLMKIPYAFERVFSTADLIPIAGLLMLGASREIDMESRLNRVSKDMYIFKQIGIFLPILMFLLYSTLKYYAMTYHFPTENDKSIDEVICSIPYLSFTIITISGCFCFMAKWGIISSLKMEKTE